MELYSESSLGGGGRTHKTSSSGRLKNVPSGRSTSSLSDKFLHTGDTHENTVPARLSSGAVNYCTRAAHTDKDMEVKYEIIEVSNIVCKAARRHTLRQGVESSRVEGYSTSEMSLLLFSFNKNIPGKKQLSCEIENFVETHLGKVCVLLILLILRLRVLRVLFGLMQDIHLVYKGDKT